MPGVSTYEIRLSGCDDATVFVMDLTGAEADAVRRVADRSREVSTFSCEPVMTVTPADQAIPEKEITP